MRELTNLRAAYGETLVKLGEANPDIVALDADLSKSTMSSLFQQRFPERFFEMGIAEANMASVAAGLSLMGKIPFFSSFAVFSTGRCYDQIRTSICVPGLNVKICGSSAGLSDFGDGSTHQSVEDIAIMRALPNMRVFVPADALQLRQIVQYMAENPGPMYLRVCRNELPAVTRETDAFVPGKPVKLLEGGDAVVFATGAMVGPALDAAELLRGDGIALSVVNLPSIKPLDADAVAEIVASHDAVLTAEEHSLIGGLNSAVLGALSERCAKSVYGIGINDRFGTSAESYPVLMRAYGLTAERIAARVREALKEKCKEL
jgi:transketolase